MTRAVDDEGPAEARSAHVGTEHFVTASPAMPDTKRGRAVIGRLASVGLTIALCAVAGLLGWRAFSVYTATPWTRDGAVRAYTVSLAPEVSGRVIDLPIRDNQYVHRGDLLMRIDPRDYQNTVDVDQALVDQAKSDLANKKSQAARRDKLSDLAVTAEEQQNYNTGANTAAAALRQHEAHLNQAKLNLERTEIHSPVNGWITNLLLQPGDYATTGARSLSVVDADSFWVDGYFEETLIKPIQVGDPARVWLMGATDVIRGHVESLAHGINVANAAPNDAGLANVNPVFTWVRLAQRVPVRVHIDAVPPNLLLAAGMTATVQIDPPPQRGNADRRRSNDRTVDLR